MAIVGAAAWALAAGGGGLDRAAVPAGGGVVDRAAVSAGRDGADRAAAPARGCDARLARGPIPTWARSGFTEPEPRLPHAVGRDGEIAALVFGDPLSSPPAPGRNNKILWVSRVPAPSPSDLRIRARRYEGARPVGRTVTRVVPGGPGPSIVDLPAPGCWRLRLQWSGHADTVDLEYRAQPSISVREAGMS